MPLGVQSSRRLRAVVATALFVAVVWSLRLASAGHAWFETVADVATGGLAALAVGLCVRAERRVRFTGGAWLVTAAGLWGAADLLRLFVDSASPTAFPSPNDAVYVVGMVPLLVGAWKLCQDGSTRHEQLRSLFDGLLIASSLVLVFWWSVLGAFRSSGLGVAGTALALCYVLGDLLVVTTVQSSRHVSDPRRHDLRLFGAAFVIVALGDAAFVYSLSDDALDRLRLPELGWLVGYALIGWAAHVAQPPGRAQQRQRIRDIYLYGSIAAAVAVTAISLVMRSRLQPVQGWGVVALAVLGVARHYASQRENDDLRARLERQVAALSESEERFRRSFDAAPIGMALVSSAGSIVEANGAYAAMVGVPVDDLVGAAVVDFTHPDDVEIDRRHVDEMLARGESQKRWEKRLVHAGGDHVWVSITISLVPLPNGDFELVNQVEDITERRATLAELAHNARHDILTGIPNRAHFEEQLAIALERAAISGTRVAVAFLDVDRFKIVNDNLGHRYGDELLRVVAARLKESTRAGDLVARFGGDEFTAMFCDVPNEDVALSIAQRLIDRVCRPIELDDGETFVSLSVGLALSVPSMDASAVDLMLSNADAAMYRAKEAGRDRIELHADTSERSSVNRLRLVNDLHRALEREELRLHYQPIVRLETGEIRSCEALLRWEHGQHGMLPPGEFVHLAEDSGLVVPIGHWTIVAACRQLAAWNDGYPGRPMRCSVNLSSRQLDTGDLTAIVARAIEETGIDPDWMWFEITESTLMRETTEAIATMRRLRDLGVHLAIDDFGTGYSSLAYLRRFPVEALKIDRSFVAGLGANDEDTTIVRAVVDLAHALRLTAVAEGVETESQLERLRAVGCDLAQGWYFGMPSPANAVPDPRSGAEWPRPDAADERAAQDAPAEHDVPRGLGASRALSET